MKDALFTKLTPLATVLMLSVSGNASAQQGMDAHGFVLSAQDGDPRDYLALQRPGAFQAGDFFATGVLEYAESPLTVIYRYPAGRPDETGVALDNVMAMNLSAGIAVHKRIRLDLSAPLFFSTTGEFETQQGLGIGDMRLSSMVSILAPNRSAGQSFGLGFVPSVSIPTGNDERFIGMGGFAGGGTIAATYEASQFTVSGNVGAQLNPSLEFANLTGVHQAQIGLGGGYLFSPELSLNAEVYALPYLASNGDGEFGLPAEAIVSMRGRTESGGHWLAGGSMGLSNGPGTAVYRIFVGGGYGKMSAIGPIDRDLDGIMDALDSCRAEAEVINGYRDDDGCPDSLGNLLIQVYDEGRIRAGIEVTAEGPTEDDYEIYDSGPDPIELTVTPESTWILRATAHGFWAKQRIEVQEGDNIIKLDLEPTAEVRIAAVTQDGQPVPKAGVALITEDELPTGFPLRPDGTTILELAAGKHVIVVQAEWSSVFRKEITVESGGSAEVIAVLLDAHAKITQTHIEIDDRIYFEQNSANISAKSFPLLDEIANLILFHPDIQLIEIAGHTSSEASEEYNQQLSENRAKSVRAYLIVRGVHPDILQANGYGETQLVSGNDSEEQRRLNRRVEFKILRRQ